VQNALAVGAADPPVTTVFPAELRLVLAESVEDAVRNVVPAVAAERVVAHDEE
jgi:hypothetical protein